MNAGDSEASLVSPQPISTLLRRRPARTAREWPNHRENALKFVGGDQMGSVTAATTPFTCGG